MTEMKFPMCRDQCPMDGRAGLRGHGSLVVGHWLFRAKRGFTLVEVLVALCIFAMAAVVLGSAYVNVLTGYEVVSRGVQIN